MEIPQKVDLSVYCPTAKFQYRATCYAYAFAYTAISINYCVKNSITKPGDVNANAFSPGFIASIHRKQSFFNPRCGMGGSYEKSRDIFADYGCPKLTDFDIDCTTNIPSGVYTKAKAVSLKEYVCIQEERDQSVAAVENIKTVLASNIPVLIVINATNSFSNIKGNNLPVLVNEKRHDTAHDICIIGYDDNPSSATFQRFLIKNNYSNWGDERAMAWVKYDDMMYLISYAAYFTIN